MMRLNKRGIEMSLQTVVLAVIMLLVATILIMFVLRSTGGAQETLNDCPSKGGSCQSSCAPGEQPYHLASCPNEGDTCCISADSLLDSGR